MVGDIKEVQSKARTMAGTEVKQEEGAKKKVDQNEFKKEDVTEESLKAFADTVYAMFEEQCADEIKAVQEFPEEVARLKAKHSKVKALMQKEEKNKWVPAIQAYQAQKKNQAEAKN